LKNVTIPIFMGPTVS